MPSYKNQFEGPRYIEQTILDSDGKKVGTLRLKPSSVQWKPTNHHQFYTVTLDEFAKWITNFESAKRTKS